MAERVVHDDLRHCQDLVLRNADLEKLNSPKPTLTVFAACFHDAP